MPVNIFVSYARDDVQTDENLIDEFLKHGKARERTGEIEIFKDTERIDFGDVWKNKIDDALEKTDIALLFISANFIASDFIFEHELKVLLKKHRNQNIAILPILLGLCEWDIIEELSQFQIYPDSEESLRSMNKDVFEAKAMEFFSKVLPRKYPDSREADNDKNIDTLEELQADESFEYFTFDDETAPKNSEYYIWSDKEFLSSEGVPKFTKITERIVTNEIKKAYPENFKNINTIFTSLINWGEAYLEKPGLGKIRWGQYNPKHKFGSVGFIYWKNGSMKPDDRYYLFRVSTQGLISPSFWWNTQNYSNIDKKPFNDFEFQKEVLTKLSQLGFRQYGGELDSSSELTAIDSVNAFTKRDIFVNPAEIKGFDANGFLSVINFIISEIEKN